MSFIMYVEKHDTSEHPEFEVIATKRKRNLRFCGLKFYYKNLQQATTASAHGQELESVIYLIWFEIWMKTQLL